MNTLFNLIIETIHQFKKKVFRQVDLSQIPILRSIRYWLISHQKKKFMPNIHGHKMFLDKIDSLSLSWHKEFEPGETRFFNQFLREKDVVVDIGANIGYFTLLFARRVGPEGRVFAFEPDPENIDLLRKNIEINNYKNITVVNKAVAEVTGSKKLYLSDDNYGDHRIYDSQDQRKSVDINTVRLDDYFLDQNQKIDVIKMDIQGAEGLALEGMGPLLTKLDNLLLVTEYSPSALRRAGTNPGDFIDGLHRHGFDIFSFDKKSDKIIKSDLDWLRRGCDFTLDMDFVNLICQKGSSRMGWS